MSQLILILGFHSEHCRGLYSGLSNFPARDPWYTKRKTVRLVFIQEQSAHNQSAFVAKKMRECYQHLRSPEAQGYDQVIQVSG